MISHEKYCQILRFPNLTPYAISKQVGVSPATVKRVRCDAQRGGGQYISWAIKRVDRYVCRLTDPPHSTIWYPCPVCLARRSEKNLLPDRPDDEDSSLVDPDDDTIQAITQVIRTKGFVDSVGRRHDPW